MVMNKDKELYFKSKCNYTLGKSCKSCRFLFNYSSSAYECCVCDHPDNQWETLSGQVERFDVCKDACCDYWELGEHS